MDENTAKQMVNRMAAWGKDIQKDMAVDYSDIDMTDAILAGREGQERNELMLRAVAWAHILKDKMDHRIIHSNISREQFLKIMGSRDIMSQIKICTRTMVTNETVPDEIIRLYLDCVKTRKMIEKEIALKQRARK